MRERFVEKTFKAETLATIETANGIIAEYQAQGFKLTLRQLYYQFVARALIPNKQTEYKRLGSIVNDGRLAGLIDWGAIEDRTRALHRLGTWSSPSKYIMAESYMEDLWASQPYRPEVWVEKEALAGVFETICDELRVPLFACRGYTSQSAAYEAGKRFARYARYGGKPVVFHFGDHDPSGLDMTRDNDERINLFARHGVSVRRLALNRDQIDEHEPPPNPAKETDARFEGYRMEHGDESWELDALEPAILTDLVHDAIDGIRDDEAWSDAEKKEGKNRELLHDVTRRWEEVAQFLKED